MAQKYITHLVYGQSKWITLSHHRKDLVGQSLTCSPAKEGFPLDKVNKLLDSGGKRISQVVFGDNTWLVLADSLMHGDKIPHTIFVQAKFPLEEISSGWKRGQRVSCITHGNGIWVVIMERAPKGSEQSIVWQKEFPKDRIHQYWDTGRRIQILTWGDGMWICLAEKLDTGIQTFLISSDFPTDKIESYYKVHKCVASICYAGDKEDVWAIIAEPSTSAQKILCDTRFPEDEFKSLGLPIFGKLPG